MLAPGPLRVCKRTGSLCPVRPSPLSRRCLAALWAGTGPHTPSLRVAPARPAAIEAPRGGQPCTSSAHLLSMCSLRPCSGSWGAWLACSGAGSTFASCTGAVGSRRNQNAARWPPCAALCFLGLLLSPGGGARPGGGPVLPPAGPSPPHPARPQQEAPNSTAIPRAPQSCAAEVISGRGRPDLRCDPAALSF